jgi:ankyrin repeat protein
MVNKRKYTDEETDEETDENMQELTKRKRNRRSRLDFTADSTQCIEKDGSNESILNNMTEEECALILVGMDDIGQEQRKIGLCMKLLKHMTRCVNDKCPSNNCKKMKLALQHKKICKVNVKGGCKICFHISTLLKKHAKDCKDSNCKIIECKKIKEDNIILKAQQQRLILLQHASRCEAGTAGHPKNCPITKKCAEWKKLWKHIANCKDKDYKDCRTKNCISSRYVLSHYHHCKDKKCKVCAPVRAAIDVNNKKRVKITAAAQKKDPLYVFQQAKALSDGGADPNQVGGSASVWKTDQVRISAAKKKYKRKKVPLCAALQANDDDAVEALLDDKADPNEVLTYGINALHVAAEKGCSLPLFGRILGMINNVNAADNCGVTALMYAVQKKRLDMVVLLMNHKDIDVNIQEKHYNTTALHKAIEANYSDIVTQLINDDRVDTSLRNGFNKTPLDVARDLRRIKCAKILREHKFKKNIIKIQDEIERDHEQARKKAAMKKYQRKKAPLCAALKEKDEVAVEALLDGKADPNEVNEYGFNALHVAAWKGCRLPLFRRILGMIRNVNKGDSWNNSTALMHAALSNHLDMVVSLMNHPGIDVNVQDRDNNTALHKAIKKRCYAIVAQLLSDDRVDTSLKNKENYTPLKFAIVTSYLTTQERIHYVKILREHGAPEN